MTTWGILSTARINRLILARASLGFTLEALHRSAETGVPVEIELSVPRLVPPDQRSDS